MSAAFISAVADWSDKVYRQVQQVVREATAEVHERIVDATPIDTGRAMSSWNIATGDAPDLTVTPLLADIRDAATGEVIEAAAKGASPLHRGQARSAATNQQRKLEGMYEPVTVVSNNLHYIVALENGSSQQAGPGEMFALKVQELPAIVAAAVARL